MPDIRENRDGLTPSNVTDPLAGALTRLAPATPGFDRDALLFTAGRATQAAATARWRWTSAAALLAAVGAWAFALTDPKSSPTGAISSTPSIAPDRQTGTPEPKLESSDPGPTQRLYTFTDDFDPSYRVKGLQLRNDVLAAILWIIPSTSHPNKETDSTWDDVERFLGFPAESSVNPKFEKRPPMPNDPG
ncbi:MAG TPA: hypothetical protein VGJ05_04250 [Fimbriiglobus sp.]|jgi:hypothetical protein